MKTAISIITLLLSFASFAQLTAEETAASREEHAKELSDTTYGVLNQEEIDAFHGLDYFDFNSLLQVEAAFTKSVGKVFKMPTSTERTPKYRRYGYVDFEVNGVTCHLEVYQNMPLRKDKEYKDYLFLPYRDLTSSNETYGGGRFLDVRIPKGKTLIIDFNQAYNPYCAYSYRYSCPIPPACNTLNVKIEAGEKVPLGH
jgi:uncharacterized protein (DUF1684 family)